MLSPLLINITPWRPTPLLSIYTNTAQSTNNNKANTLSSVNCTPLIPSSLICGFRSSRLLSPADSMLFLLIFIQLTPTQQNHSLIRAPIIINKQTRDTCSYTLLAFHCSLSPIATPRSFMQTMSTARPLVSIILLQESCSSPYSNSSSLLSFW